MTHQRVSFRKPPISANFGEERVLVVNLSTDGAILRQTSDQNSETISDFDTLACHSFFRIVPDHTRAVAVGNDDADVVSGMLLLSQDRGWLLACTRPDGQRHYFDLPSLSKSLPYFNRAICYAAWDIYIPQHPTIGVDHINVFSFRRQ